MPKPPKATYYIEKVLGDVIKGPGWIEFDLTVAQRLGGLFHVKLLLQ
ncbi:MAG: hypothetical protein N5P05_004684 (plasmid) [Chroococcopsis gigantea SAG 12.99]|nr:hypothetical protein [Chroococcopsis gigantea SAG 12.99]